MTEASENFHCVCMCRPILLHNVKGTLCQATDLPLHAMRGQWPESILPDWQMRSNVIEDITQVASQLASKGNVTTVGREFPSQLLDLPQQSSMLSRMDALRPHKRQELIQPGLPVAALVFADGRHKSSAILWENIHELTNCPVGRTVHPDILERANARGRIHQGLDAAKRCLDNLNPISKRAQR